MIYLYIVTPGYSVAGGEFSGDDDEGKAHVDSAQNQNARLTCLGLVTPPHNSVKHLRSAVVMEKARWKLLDSIKVREWVTPNRKQIIPTAD